MIHGSCLMTTMQIESRMMGYECVCMYVCMYVCIHTYVCVYVNSTYTVIINGNCSMNMMQIGSIYIYTHTHIYIYI